MAPKVRNGGSHHPGLAAPPHRNIHSKCVSSIINCVTSAAKSVFGKCVKNIAKSGVISALDGPLPVLDGISLLYVSRDIKKKYKKYRQEVASTIYNNMAEGMTNIRKESLNAGCKIFDDYMFIIKEMKNKVEANN